MLDPGKYNKLIYIYQVVTEEDDCGFKNPEKTLLLQTWASVKTTKGFTLIANNSDFEKAYTNFTIRFPSTTLLNRDMLIEFRDKLYTIEYMNNVNEDCWELEMQCREITH